MNDEYIKQLENSVGTLEDTLSELSKENRFLRALVKIEGYSFCFTGSLKTMTRHEAKRIVESKKGIVKQSVTKGLHYLVTNDSDSGTIKNKVAVESGVKIINENEFIYLIKS